MAEEKATGNFVGEVGFADLKRELETSLQAMPEIGWVLASQAHGKGYATEAARAVIAWGEQHFGPSPTNCIIGPGNAASIRVAEKCGYAELERTLYKGVPVIIYLRVWGME